MGVECCHKVVELLSECPDVDETSEAATVDGDALCLVACHDDETVEVAVECSCYDLRADGRGDEQFTVLVLQTGTDAHSWYDE